MYPTMTPRPSTLPATPLLDAAAVLLLVSVAVAPAAAAHVPSTGFAFVPRPDGLPSSLSAALPVFCSGTTTSTSARAPPARGQMDMKVSKGKSRGRKDSSLAVLNNERKRLAGRRGTKRFVDPTKLFIGNLPYTADEARVLSWLGEQLGETGYIDSLKIIRDYKTGRSKGYGFVTFQDPIFATSAMETVKGKMLDGRVINLNQGQRRVDPNVLYVQRRKNKTEEGDDEGEVIDSALDYAEGLEDEDENEGSVENILTVQDFDSVSDADLFGDVDDDDDDGIGSGDDLENFVFDGVFEEEYKAELGFCGGEEVGGTEMNREQRRDAARRKPRRKLPHKGFGPQIET